MKNTKLDNKNENLNIVSHKLTATEIENGYLDLSALKDAECRRIFHNNKSFTLRFLGREYPNMKADLTKRLIILDKEFMNKLNDYGILKTFDQVQRKFEDLFTDIRTHYIVPGGEKILQLSEFLIDLLDSNIELFYKDTQIDSENYYRSFLKSGIYHDKEDARYYIKRLRELVMNNMGWWSDE